MSAVSLLSPSSLPSSPIGIFDSGVGGLSVLRHIRASLPQENLLYFADSAYAPYGERPEQEIVARSLAVADFLLQKKAKALVVACNTATAAAIRALRERYPAMPVVGVEPGLKPAAALTRSGTVGVLATERTLSSLKFAQLRDQLLAATGIRFLAQPCTGLADRIEKGELASPGTARLLHGYIIPLLEQGADTLVLGCTHYPFVRPLLENLLHRGSPRVAIVDTGEAVARQLVRLLDTHGLRNTGEEAGALYGFTTGSSSGLASAFEKLLRQQPSVAQIAATAEQCMYDCAGFGAAKKV